ncbi:MAG: hypothetical protein CMP48_03170 [Rickettsiales bacterium]|nr:hypothetical protein [Rickettsiales bacterium]
MRRSAGLHVVDVLSDRAIPPGRVIFGVRDGADDGAVLERDDAAVVRRAGRRRHLAGRQHDAVGAHHLGEPGVDLHRLLVPGAVGLGDPLALGAGLAHPERIIHVAANEGAVDVDPLDLVGAVVVFLERPVRAGLGQAQAEARRLVDHLLELGQRAAILEEVRPVLALRARHLETADVPESMLADALRHALAGGVVVVAEIDRVPGLPEIAVAPFLGDAGSVGRADDRHAAVEACALDLLAETPEVLHALGHKEHGLAARGAVPVGQRRAGAPALVVARIGGEARDRGLRRPRQEPAFTIDDRRGDRAGHLLLDRCPRRIGLGDAEAEARDGLRVQTASLKVGDGLRAAFQGALHALVGVRVDRRGVLRAGRGFRTLCRRGDALQAGLRAQEFPEIGDCADEVTAPDLHDSVDQAALLAAAGRVEVDEAARVLPGNLDLAAPTLTAAYIGQTVGIALPVVGGLAVVERLEHAHDVALLGQERLDLFDIVAAGGHGQVALPLRRDRGGSCMITDRASSYWCSALNSA